MKLTEIILKIGSVTAHLVATGLAVDAVRNVYNGITTGQQGYYQLAAIEAIVSTGIEIRQYFEREKRRNHQDILQKLDSCIQETNQEEYDKP